MVFIKFQPYLKNFDFMFIFFACLYTPLRGAKKTNQQRSGERKGTLSLAMWSSHTAVRLRRIPGVYTPLRGTPQSCRDQKNSPAAGGLKQLLLLFGSFSGARLRAKGKTS